MATETTTKNKKISPFEGKFHLVSQENYDEYLKKIGVPAERRGSLESSVSKSGVHMTCIVNEDGVWSLEIVSGLYTVFSFKLGVEHERHSHDGRLIKSIFKLEGTNKLVHHEHWGDQELTSVHEISSDGRDWITTITAGEVTCVRKYARDWTQ